MEDEGEQKEMDRGWRRMEGRWMDDGGDGGRMDGG